MSAKPTFATILKMGLVSGTLVALNELVNITPPKASRDAVDVTTHGSTGGAMEVMPDGIYDPGEMQFSKLYTANDADDIALTLALTAGAVRFFSWEVKGGVKGRIFSAAGVVTSYGPDDMPLKGKQTATGTIKITGQVTSTDAP